jgi:hypothetical protein
LNGDDWNIRLEWRMQVPAAGAALNTGQSTEA